MFVKRNKISCVKDIRNNCGLTGREVADLIGVSPSLIYQFESMHRNPRGVATIKIAMLYAIMSSFCGMEDILWKELTADGQSNTAKVSGID